MDAKGRVRNFAERIILRPTQIFHAEGMLKKMDPETAPNLQFCAEPITPKRQLDYLARMIQSPIDHLFTIMLRDGGIIGTIGLHEHDKFNRTARLGRWIFSKEDRCKEYGSEAVFVLFRDIAFAPVFEPRVPRDEGFPLNKIYVNLFTDNPSRKYYEKLGFLEECVLKKEYLLRDKYVDMTRFCLFREDWENVFK